MVIVAERIELPLSHEERQYLMQAISDHKYERIKVGTGRKMPGDPGFQRPDSWGPLVDPQDVLAEPVSQEA